MPYHILYRAYATHTNILCPRPIPSKQSVALAIYSPRSIHSRPYYIIYCAHPYTPTPTHGSAANPHAPTPPRDPNAPLSCPVTRPPAPAHPRQSQRGPQHVTAGQSRAALAAAARDSLSARCASVRPLPSAAAARSLLLAWCSHTFSTPCPLPDIYTLGSVLLRCCNCDC